MSEMNGEAGNGKLDNAGSGAKDVPPKVELSRKHGNKAQQTQFGKQNAGETTGMTQYKRD